MPPLPSKRNEFCSSRRLCKVLLASYALGRLHQQTHSIRRHFHHDLLAASVILDTLTDSGTMVSSEHSSTRTAIIQLALAFVLYRSTWAANWAQLSGDERQEITTTKPSGFTARFGAATTVVERPEPELGEQLPDIEVTRLVLFGGDDYSVEAGQGSYRNDYWYTIGPRESSWRRVPPSAELPGCIQHPFCCTQLRHVASESHPAAPTIT